MSPCASCGIPASAPGPDRLEEERDRHGRPHRVDDALPCGLQPVLGVVPGKAHALAPGDVRDVDDQRVALLRLEVGVRARVVEREVTERRHADVTEDVAEPLDQVRAVVNAEVDDEVFEVPEHAERTAHSARGDET